MPETKNATEIRLTNTKTRKKEAFVPIDANNVRMYVCGPTVYDRAHIGNARPVIVFDVLYRLLRHVYGENHVTYVRNFTDVDDKINAKAAQTGRSIREITDETIGWYLDDMRSVGALDPDQMPRATEYIAQMITMIETLIAKDHAYSDGAGHVLFSVKSYEKYGALSRRSVDDMIAGARVEVADNKRDPMDFVLWKPSEGDQPGWDSPWGKGRPGWHIECSAMAKDILGDTFDIHGGGNDLMFPHHENEIAQSCCASGHADDGKGFANYWLHNEMLQVEGKKMSKSLGNFFTVRDLLDGHDGQAPVPGEVIRFVFLSTHYRKPMDWTQEKADQAKATLKKWYAQAEKDVPNSEPDIEVIRALSDDLNTAGAISVLHRLSNENNESALRSSLQLLGLMGNNAPSWTKSSVLHANSYRAFHKILRRRHLAREQKQWAVADFIRDSFLELGVTLKDQEGGKVAPSTNFEFVEEYFRSLAEKESRELLGDSYKAGGSMIAQSMADAYSIYAAEKVLSMIESKFPEEGTK